MNRRDFIASTVAAASALALDVHAGQASVSSFPSTAERGTDAGDLSRVWPPADGVFPAALLSGSGFSFSYDGSPAGPPKSISEKEFKDSIETTFRYSSGVEAIRTATQFPEFGAVEYSVRLRNAGSARSAIIQDVLALNLAFGPAALHGSHIVSSGGGTAKSTYPPASFKIAEHYLGASVPADGGISLTTRGGRSSDLDLPFYFIHNDDRSAGLFVAIGWTGQWQSSASGDFSHEKLLVTGGMPDVHVALRPGEEISGPRILVGSYSGPLSNGSNRLRRLVREHYTPKLGGRPFGPISTYDMWWNIGEEYNEALLLPLADTAASIGQEYFLLDAAWYIGSNGPQGFSGGVGNWGQVDRTKFPSGLEHFANYVRSRGLKFGLWFEPERVARGSLLAQQHPDWVIWLGDNYYGLLDYGRKDVQHWACKMLDDHINKYSIRYIRHDFNIAPLAYWNSRDAANRRGISQIKHIEGLYTVIDWIRNRHPETVLECCASGGRRIDLETARRFHTFWISDYTVDPEIVRFHLQGINYFLPGNYHYVCYTLPISTQKDFKPTNSDYLSFFGGAFGTGGRIDLWPTEQKERFLVMEKLYKTLRPYLMKDYYPLLPQSRDTKSWDASQFHDPESNAGFVQVFRGKTDDSSNRLALFGLKSTAVYEVHAPLDGWKLRITGKSAMEDGIQFKQSPMSAAIVTYSTV